LSFTASLDGSGGFPPPPLPVAPQGFNIYCDVCETMVKRMVPYCQRVDQNLDYLPDFCTFNYNKVLRTECDYVVNVAEFSWCPNACEELRRVQSYGVSLCHEGLINCTERNFLPSSTPSPSPSPSPSVAPDCVLCGYLLQNLALLCMNQEVVNQRTTYETCMKITQTRDYYEHCTMFLGEVVQIAGSRDPCKLLQCEQPQLSCSMLSDGCHVTPYNQSFPTEFSFNSTKKESTYENTQGLGPGDFRPGYKPYSSSLPLTPNLSDQDRTAGSYFTPTNATVPVTPDEIAKKEQMDAAQANSDNSKIASAATPAPVPLKDIKLQ